VQRVSQEDTDSTVRKSVVVEPIQFVIEQLVAATVSQDSTDQIALNVSEVQWRISLIDFWL